MQGRSLVPILRGKTPEDWRPFASGGYATASGKADLYSAALEAAGLQPFGENGGWTMAKALLGTRPERP